MLIYVYSFPLLSCSSSFGLAFFQIVFDEIINYNIRITILTIFSLLVILFDVVKFPNDPCLGEDPFGRVSLIDFYYDRY